MKIIRQFFCRHKYKFVRNIYGDEIIQWGWKRSIWRCHKCGKVMGSGLLVTDEKGGAS